jgi:anaerobic ribonucleoside-triphosphate reductase activating protein
VNFLVQKLIALPQLDGLTISGGEPMLQAAALSNLIQSVRKIRTMNVICFSGYTLAQLRTQPPSPEVEHLLTAIDVLVDGPYIDQANDDHGLRGSSNQQIHYLTPVLRDVDLSDHPRSVEMHLDNGEVLIVGVPPKKFSAAFDRFHTFPRAATPIGGS